MSFTKRMACFAAIAVLAGALGLASPVLAQSQGTDPVKHFNYMDKEKKGYLTEENFKMMGKDYKQQFQDADANKDGKITLDEYKAWDAKQKKAMPGMNM